MRKILMPVLAFVICALLAGCDGSNLPPGDRDEIGQDVIEITPEPESDSANPLGWRNSESDSPVQGISGLSASDMPVLLVLNQASAGPGLDSDMAYAELESGALFTDTAGEYWLDCESLNQAAGFDLISESASGVLRFRQAASPELFAWDLDRGVLLLSLDVLSSYACVTGFGESDWAGITPGDKLSDKDRPVFESVLAAVGDAIKSDKPAIILDIRLQDRYIHESEIYIKTDESVDLDLIPSNPVNLTFDGRRVWHDRDGTIWIESDFNDTAVRFVTEDTDDN